ncbi:hypothetical protein HGM15179_005390 [Zosterops borbonicus]|uniref:Uncharacterized protein n=1 Tax=Zosterops borbonicus TaxID=364589 RepID=A0A8K1LQ09_9PASS|nr:hypothetical protein HGM15179_005390 [Zosterops borbonicus]
MPAHISQQKPCRAVTIQQRGRGTNGILNTNEILKIYARCAGEGNSTTATAAGGARTCERNSSADTKISEEGGGGGAPGVEAETPCTPGADHAEEKSNRAALVGISEENIMKGIVIPDQIRVIDTQVVILTPAQKFGDVQLITGLGASQQCGISLVYYCIYQLVSIFEAPRNHGNDCHREAHEEINHSASIVGLESCAVGFVCSSLAIISDAVDSLPGLQLLLLLSGLTWILSAFSTQMPQVSQDILGTYLMPLSPSHSRHRYEGKAGRDF